MKVVPVVVTLCALLFAAPAIAQDQGTRLRAAVASFDLSSVKKLATSAAIANSANSDGVTALMIATAQDSVAIVSALLKAGADPNIKAKTAGVTALMLAAHYGRMEAARALVEKGADLKATDADGLGVVDYAVLARGLNQERAIPVGRYLLEKGAKVTLSQDNALGSLLSVGKGKTIEELLDRARLP